MNPEDPVYLSLFRFGRSRSGPSTGLDYWQKDGEGFNFELLSSRSKVSKSREIKLGKRQTVSTVHFVTQVLEAI